jgi:hypothetical protein
MILITEGYSPPDDGRAAELLHCRTANAGLGVFERTVVLDGDEARATYGSVFRMCAEQHAGEVCVLANADIVFDQTAALIAGVVSRGTLVALTRWENGSSPMMLGHQVDRRFYSGAQDVWAFVGGDFVGCGDQIPLGVVGCDQAVLGEVVGAGGSVVNPCLSIKTKHVHAAKDRPPRPCVAGLYVYPEITTLETTGAYVWHQWPQEEIHADRNA